MDNPSLPVSPAQRRYATIAMLLSWFGLALQLYLVLWGRWVDQASLLGGLVKFFSFFTVLTNTLVAVALTCAAREPLTAAQRFFRSPVICGGITTSILLVGIAYNILLRHLWHPEGWQRVADELLHDIMPLLFLGYWWLFVEKGRLRLKHLLLWMLYPLLYFGYVLFRGDMYGDYVYPFIDIGTLGFVVALKNALGVLAGFVAVGLIIVLLDKRLARLR
jgi:hypothetical protein